MKHPSLLNLQYSNRLNRNVKETISQSIKSKYEQLISGSCHNRCCIK